MPSAEHELPIALARADPDLIATMLRDIFGVEVPAHASSRSHAADVQIAVPSTYHADAMLVFDDAENQPVLAVVLEVQRRWDLGKRHTWRLYLAHLEAELKVPAALVVYCPRPNVGERYRRLLTKDGMSLMLRPFIVTPDDLPLITDPEAAARTPSMAVMTALAHAHDAEIEVAFPALAAAVNAVGPDKMNSYYDMVLAALPRPLMADWRDFMSSIDEAPYFSEEMRRRWYYERSTGRAEGIAQGKAEDIVTVLSARGIDVSDDERTRIGAVTDTETLDQMLRRAATADAAADLWTN